MAKIDATAQVAMIPAESMMLIFGSVLVYGLLCGAIAAVFKIYNVRTHEAADSFVGKVARSKQFWMRSLFFVMATIIGILRIEDTCGRGEETEYCDNWHMMYWYGLALIMTANISTLPFEFYLGEGVNLVDYLKFFFRSHKIASPTELGEASRQRWTNGREVAEGSVTFSTLMPSVFISWIFAKSIRNSSTLGSMYGMLGGLAYASWYLSFFSGGFVCYILRTKYKFKSLPIAVYKTYGPVAVIFFQLCLFFRLFNEVWSNAGVIGTFYGAAGTPGYWGGAWLSVLIPVVYTCMGGMRASLFSDVFQAWLAILFLVVVLATISSDSGFSEKTDAFSWGPTTLYKPNGEWYDGGWWACFVAGSIQGVISYPFFDPVLTDRAFLGTPKTMLLSFFVGGVLAALFIIFFAVIGIYGAFWKEQYINDCGCIAGLRGINPSASCPMDWNPCAYLTGTTGETSDVAVILSRHTYGAVGVFINFIMITASMSTLDSTFTSTSKLISLEFCGWLSLAGDKRDHSGPLQPQDLDNIGDTHIAIARAVIVILAFFSTAFLGLEGDVMQATTAAGTCVMGIGAPIWFMTVWRTKGEGRRGWRQAPLAFIVPTVVGFVFGLSYWQNGLKDENGEAYKGWTYDILVGHDDNKPTFYYSRFLGVNLLGHGICIALFFVFFAFHQLLPPSFERFFPQVEPESEKGTVIGAAVAGAEEKTVDVKL
jgi:urea-proton symporter